MKIENKHIYINRGDRGTIHLINNSNIFNFGDYIFFTICQKGDYSNVILQKRFDITENTDAIDLELTSQDTQIGEPLIDSSVDYWYEIKLNGDTTLIGYDKNGPKIFTLWPEAGEVEV